MNVEMAYLIGMILGNGEIQTTSTDTRITIDIPYKNLFTDDFKDVGVYVNASLLDILSFIAPLLGSTVKYTKFIHSTMLSFTKPNSEYTIREILRLIDGGRHHSSMRMNPELFSITTDEKKSLLRGIADTTGYIRKSNSERGKGTNRVYIEVPRNWYMVIDIANMLKDVDIPIQNINFGHPNFRDPKLENYNNKKFNYWKKEHQIKIFANEFLPIGFNIKHKQEALEKYANELLEYLDSKKTHRYYWQIKSKRKNNKPIHPGEWDLSLPLEIRGKHFNHWSELAECLGYGKKCK